MFEELLEIPGIELCDVEGARRANLLSMASLIGEDSTFPTLTLRPLIDGGRNLGSAITHFTKKFA
jgi:hypothetical protein